MPLGSKTKIGIFFPLKIHIHGTSWPELHTDGSQNQRPSSRSLDETWQHETTQRNHGDDSHGRIFFFTSKSPKCSQKHSQTSSFKTLHVESYMTNNQHWYPNIGSNQILFEFVRVFLQRLLWSFSVVSIHCFDSLHSSQVSPWRLAKFIAASREANPLTKISMVWNWFCISPPKGELCFKKNHDWCFQSVCCLNYIPTTLSTLWLIHQVHHSFQAPTCWRFYQPTSMEQPFRPSKGGQHLKKFGQVIIQPEQYLLKPWIGFDKYAIFSGSDIKPLPSSYQLSYWNPCSAFYSSHPTMWGQSTIELLGHWANRHTSSKARRKFSG